MNAHTDVTPRPLRTWSNCFLICLVTYQIPVSSGALLVPVLTPMLNVARDFCLVGPRRRGFLMSLVDSAH